MMEECIYCGRAPTAWCDFVIGFTDPDGDGLFSFDDGSEILRCDAPLCEGHSERVGNLFMSGAEPFADSIDHCVGHDGGDYFVPITAAQAEQIRYRHRCISLGGLRRVPAAPAGRYSEGPSLLPGDPGQDEQDA